MLELDLRLTGFGITKRGDEYLSRTIDSFKDVMDSIVNRPLLVQHPMKEDGSKALLESDTAYNLIGHISEIFPYDGGDELRCKCIVNDPIFIDFYNSLSDEDKLLLLDTSPAVVSNSIDEIDFDGKKLSKEIVESFNHLSLLVDTPSYWGRYVDTPGVMEVEQEEVPLEVTEEEIKVDFIGTVESTSNVSDKKLSPIVDNDEEKIQLNINNTNNEVSMEEKIEKEIASEVANDVIPEEIKEEASELSQEEVAHVVEEVKELNEILDSEEEIKEEEKSEEKIDEEEVKEEVKEEEKIDECGSSDENKIDSEEEVKEEVEEESEKIDEEEDKEVIDEEFETEADEEREELVKVVGNLCDSVEGFRKPAMSKRYTPEAYVRKALSLNKQFIDKKYHSLIDSIDASSLEFGKELLDSIKGSEVKEVKSHKSDYVQVAPNLYMKKFF